MKTFTIQTEITAEKLAGLLCSAFEGGVGYWCRIMDYRAPKGEIKPLLEGMDQIYRHIDYPLQGGTVVCRVTDGDCSDESFNPLRLNQTAISKGLRVMADSYPKHFSDFLADNYDATTGDVFLQCCFFGKLVYG